MNLKKMFFICLPKILFRSKIKWCTWWWWPWWQWWWPWVGWWWSWWCFSQWNLSQLSARLMFPIISDNTASHISPVTFSDHRHHHFFWSPPLQSSSSDHPPHPPVLSIISICGAHASQRPLSRPGPRWAQYSTPGLPTTAHTLHVHRPTHADTLHVHPTHTRGAFYEDTLHS